MAHSLSHRFQLKRVEHFAAASTSGPGPTQPTAWRIRLPVDKWSGNLVSSALLEDSATGAAVLPILARSIHTTPEVLPVRSGIAASALLLAATGL